jgi:hypothetical protein
MAQHEIRIRYDIATIPGACADGPVAALSFRNAAKRLVDAALSRDGLGAWTASEIGEGEVSCSFETEDPVAAEACARKALEGTPYAAVKGITRKG